MRFKGKVPVTLVGGFLGAGKTTLVNRLISSGGRRYGIVVNEFGDVGVDAALIENLESDGVTELAGGCLCCVGREDLANSLYDLLCREEPPGYVLIELSGLADPVPVAQQLMTTELRGLVELDSIVAVADARNLERTLRETPEGRAQLAYANVVVLNKADVVEGGALEEAARTIDRLNPLARVVRASYASVDAADVTGLRAMTPDWRPQGHHLRHGEGLTSFALRSERPLRMDRWASFHRRMVTRRPDRVLRTKGILRFEQLDYPMVLQTVRDLYSLVPYEKDHDGGSELVFVGKDLDEAEYRRAFEELSSPRGLMERPRRVRPG